MNEQMNANLTHGQTLCLHCEELLHPYASHCPYCQKPVTVQPAAMQSSFESIGKIAQINPFADLESRLSETRADEGKRQQSKNQESRMQESGMLDGSISRHEVVESTFASHVAHVILALFALLGGSFFFFFGLLVLMFSQNGVFRLEWNMATWPYFVGSAVTLLIVGMWSLSKIEKS